MIKWSQKSDNKKVTPVTNLYFFCYVLIISFPASAHTSEAQHNDQKGSYFRLAMC